MNTQITSIVYLISICSGILIFILSLNSYLSKQRRFWPPPSKNSWQFKLFWLLFVLFSVPLVIIIFLNLESRNSNEGLFIFGSIVTLIGFLLANLISLELGIKNSSGQKESLKTNGWYSYSRNPVYVATIITLIGTMIAIPIQDVFIISSIWIFSYVLSPFVEEPWLVGQYGDTYIKYMKTLRRFI